MRVSTPDYALRWSASSPTMGQSRRLCAPLAAKEKHQHETGRLPDNTGDEDGKPYHRFNTVGEALALAWPASRISIKAGTYSESLSFSTRIQVLATEGAATVGMGGRMSLSPSGVVNLSESGMLRLY